jgi:hypothetical protein
MVRRTRRWRAPREEIDHAALFAEATKSIVRSSALLDAYRKSSGVIIRANTSAFARERLEEEGRRCVSDLSVTGRTDVLSALEVAAKRARLAYTGDWWSTELCNAEPISLASGDEYFSWLTVRRVIERMSDPVADRVG